MTVKIFIGNVNLDTQPEQLREIFAKYGKVVEADVLRNYGFVHMESEEVAKVAIEELQGYSLNGNRIRVELSTGKSKPGGGGGRDKKPGGGGPMRGGRFGDRRGSSGGPDRGRPYPPPPRPSPYDDYYRSPYPYDYYSRRPYPPLPHPDDRLPHPDDRARYPDDRARLLPPPGDRYPPPRDRYPSPHDRYPPPHDRYPPPERYPGEEDRYPPPSRDRYAEERAAYDRSRVAPPADPYFRERAPGGGGGGGSGGGARPPPEYYNRERAQAAPRPEAGAPGRGAVAVANSYPNGYDYAFSGGATQQGQGDFRDPTQNRNGTAPNAATDYYSRFYNNANQAATKFGTGHAGGHMGAGGAGAMGMQQQQQQQRPNPNKGGSGTKYDQSFLQTGPIFF